MRDPRGRSDTAWLKISRAISETVLPWTAARSSRASRSRSSVRMVSVVRMKAVNDTLRTVERLGALYSPWSAVLASSRVTR